MNKPIDQRPLSDILFLAGGAMALVGAWMTSWQVGLLVTGVVLTVLGVVVYGLGVLRGGRRR